MSKTVLLVIHPFWTSHTRNTDYIDKIVKYSKEFDYTLILVPKIPPGIKRKLLRSALRSITKQTPIVNGVFINAIRKVFNYPDKLFGIHGSTSKFNTNNTYRTRLKRLKYLANKILSKRLPVFKSEPIIDQSFTESLEYLKSTITQTTRVIEHGYNSPFIAGQLTNNYHYTVVGEYSNQCVYQVFDILTENNIQASIHHPLTVCNPRAEYDTTKSYYAYDTDKPKINLNEAQI